MLGLDGAKHPNTGGRVVARCQQHPHHLAAHGLIDGEQPPHQRVGRTPANRLIHPAALEGHVGLHALFLEDRSLLAKVE